MNNLQLRAVTAIALGVLILGSIYLGPIYQIVVFGTFMGLGLWEFYALCNKIESVKISKIIGMSAGLFVYLLLVSMCMKLLPSMAIAVLLPLFFSLMMIELWKKHNSPLPNISLLFMGIVYVTIPFFLCIDLNLRNTESFSTVSVTFILIWTNDTMAYFIGKFFGKSQIFPSTSPKKTWEGTIGGIICTLVAGLIVGFYVHEGKLWFWIVASLLISVFAILGDLLESVFKRSLQVKDSGNILPGHGGILDRFDAALFSIPFFYCWYVLYF